MSHPSIHKAAIPCDCGCGAVIVWEFEKWSDDPREVIVDFSIAYRPRDERRARWHAAWRVLRAKEPWLHSIVLQNDGIAQLQAAISHGETA